MAKVGDTYKPGQICEGSGIYTVIHDTVHHEHHDVTVVIGEPFPPCNHCGHHPRFVVKYLAHHVGNHDHFKRHAA